MGTIGSIDKRLQQSFLGRRLREGALETVGFNFEKGQNQGWLGIRSNYHRIYQGKGAQAASAGSKALRMTGGTAMGSIGLAGSMYMLYTGYQQGGVVGAAKSAAESVFYGAAFKTAGALLGNPLTWGALAVGAAGYGAYALGEAGQRYERQIRNLEVGGDENMINAINSYGASTMRQRAAVALNNSHINRRLALGNEASMFHSSFRR